MTPKAAAALDAAIRHTMRRAKLPLIGQTVRNPKSAATNSAAAPKSKSISSSR